MWNLGAKGLAIFMKFNLDERVFFNIMTVCG